MAISRILSGRTEGLQQMPSSDPDPLMCQLAELEMTELSSLDAEAQKMTGALEKYDRGSYPMSCLPG